MKRSVRVLSIPAQHPYTQAIKPANAVYFPDPDINGNWWPHPALEANFWSSAPTEEEPAAAGGFGTAFSHLHYSLGGIDLVHLHFGFEHRTPQQIQEFVDALPIPLVVTVHDLDNPHLVTAAQQQEHHERLRILIRAAASVITLTQPAAQRLREEFSAQRVDVVPHPAITRDVPNPPRDPVAGVFLKSLRNNVISDPSFYLAIAAETPLRVFIHSDAPTRPLREALTGKVDLRVHAPFSDDELHQEVASVTTCLLPYVRGTHSGWLEMCRDVGTTVVAPDVGCYEGQADSPGTVRVYDAGDAHAAADALNRQLERGTVPYRGNRERQLHFIHGFHERLYERLVTP
ncbi:glycosyltransferase [Corynebacterium auriscanis]|uniref:Glycosyl transferase family 2 n=1 Tax=Corynebacterium auriscanis TaxID=99807 RepID=A0A0A2DGJ2_9CORY|nr:glycosyltransferase family 4 protein [Corynebacterium auriscanis]KGM18300.1 glycosyl transferase family 2 [Corynebacterium auriscanis]WJY73026.1 hypothetical protein CAURIC_07035 [Corynebacterium auriscanis]